MHCSDDALHGVEQQHGHAVCSPHADGNAWHSAHECVIPFKVLPGEAGPVDHGDPVAVDLMALHDRVREHGVASRREGFDPGAKGVSEKFLIKQAVRTIPDGLFY